MAERSCLTRLVISLGAGLAFGIFVAITLTVVDLYLAGHGRPQLGAPWLDVARVGIHLSLADVVFLGATLLAAVITWRRSA